MPLLRNLLFAWALLLALVTPAGLANADDAAAADPAADASVPEHQRLGAQSIAEYKGRRFKEAIATAKRAVALAERATGKHSQDTADQVWNLGRFQEAVGEFAGATKAFTRVLPLYEKHVGADHPYVAEVLMGLTRVRAAQQDLEGARRAFKRVVAILEPLAKKDPAVELQLAGYLAAGASLFELLNERDQAERMLLRALATYEKTYGKDNVHIAPVVALLGKLYHETGKYQQALDAHQRALRLNQKQLGPDSHWVAAAIAHVAVDLHALGRMAEAQRHFQRAIDIYSATQEHKGDSAALLLANYCAFLSERGDLPSAIEHCERAIAIFDAIHAEGYGLGLASGHLGSAYAHMGNYAEAIPHLTRSLRLRRKFWGDEHPVVGLALISLAMALDGVGEHAKGQERAQQALDLMMAAHGPDHAATADALSVMAWMRKPAERLELLERALKIRLQVLGDTHPHVARSWFDVAKARLARGEPQKARDALASCNAIREKNLTLLLGVGSEMQKSQAVSFLGVEIGASITLHLRHLPNDAEAARLAFDIILQRKGRAVDALVHDLAMLREHAKPEDRQLLDDLATTRAQLASLLLREAVTQQPGAAHDPAASAEQRRSQSVALRSKALELEERVSERSQAFRRASRRATFEQIRAAIPADAALVELIVYWPQGWDPAAKRQHEHFRFAAYVLRPDGVIRGIDLGPVPDVNRAVATLRGALGSRDSDTTAAARELHDLVMAPLTDALGDAERVFLSGDGMLSLVPFAALIDGQGKPLLERYLFTYLSGAQELVREPQRAEDRDSDDDVVLIGAPEFGSVSAAASDRAGHPLGLGFPALPGAQTEVSELDARLAGAKVLIGEAATEGAMKALRGPRVLHIATHGFFVTKQAAQTSSSSRGVETVVLPERVDLLGPLVRSGLAFAGANDGGGEGEDGVLTAMEAASLDLVGTELVVLSACETGVGATSQGDGVRGLRRSLSIAGAETQMMSLWKVDDEATRGLMLSYYDELAAGVGRSAALRNVQLAMMRDPATAHPYYWAGFIVSGSDAPLRLSKRAEPQPPKTSAGKRGCACELVGSGPAPGRGGMLLGLLLGLALRRSTRRPQRRH